MTNLPITIKYYSKINLMDIHRNFFGLFRCNNYKKENFLS
ncbi:MAG: hypothetical protein BAJALOKI2v1_110013 [Promethearchaeota archaeon]|nr:MAG: hypothetical protein BAJALOKI2v1_110013 [Candidatus Lokiarchaeota archaeon]